MSLLRTRFAVITVSIAALGGVACDDGDDDKGANAGDSGASADGSTVPPDGGEGGARDAGADVSLGGSDSGTGGSDAGIGGSDAGVGGGDAGVGGSDADMDAGPDVDAGTIRTFTDEFDDGSVFDTALSPAIVDLSGSGTVSITPPFRLEPFGNGAEGDLMFTTASQPSELEGDHHYANATVAGRISTTSDITLRVSGNLDLSGDIQTTGRVTIAVGGSVKLYGTIRALDGVFIHAHDTGDVVLDRSLVHTQDQAGGQSTGAGVELYTRGGIDCSGTCEFYTGGTSGGTASGSIALRSYGAVGGSGRWTLATGGTGRTGPAAGAIEIASEGGITMAGPSVVQPSVGGAASLITDGAIALEGTALKVQGAQLELTAQGAISIGNSSLAIDPTTVPATLRLNGQQVKLVATTIDTSTCGQGVGGSVTADIGGVLKGEGVNSPGNLTAGGGTTPGTRTVNEGASVSVAPIVTGLVVDESATSLPRTVVGGPSGAIVAAPTFDFSPAAGPPSASLHISPTGALSGFIAASSVTTIDQGWRYRVLLQTRMFDASAGERITFQYVN